MFHYSLDDEEFLIDKYLEKIENAHSSISSLLSVDFEKKTPVFIYYNHNHFEQNRIAPAEEGVEGFSEAFKNRLVIPVRYSEYDMDHLIAHEYVHIVQFEVLYSGFWRSSKLIKGLSGLQPLWIIEGMAENISHKVLGREWSSYDRMVLRDAVIFDSLYKIPELQNFAALYRDVYLGYKEGHSAIDYLVEIEGFSVYKKLLKSLRNNIDPIKAFEVSVDSFTSLYDFDLKWRKQLINKTKEFMEGKESILEISTPLVSNKYYNKDPEPDAGGGFYYVGDISGLNEIYYHSNKDKITKILPHFFGSNVKRLVTGRRFDSVIDLDNSGKYLVFAVREGQKDFIVIHDVNRAETNKIKTELKEVRSPSFSNDSEKIVFTALKNSKRDIFIYNLKSKEITQISNDDNIEYAPFFRDSSSILASTERALNTDLCLYEVSSKKKLWITQTPENEIHPSLSQGGDLIYSSDRNSVFNIYSIKKSGDKYEDEKMLSNISGGIFYPKSSGVNEVVASSYYKRSFNIIKIRLASDEVKEKKANNKREYYSARLSEDFVFEKITERPYRFSIATDFFFPSFLYSSDVGFVGGGYYRISDMLAHNTFDLYGWGWPGIYEATLQYMLTKYRSNVYINTSIKGEEYIQTYISLPEEEFSETNYSADIGLVYPFNEFWSMTNWVTTGFNNEKNISRDVNIHETENGIGLGITRNTAVLEPFTAIRGSLFNISAYKAGEFNKLSKIYNQYQMSLIRYETIIKKLVIANRIFMARTEGADSGIFYLDNARGSFELSSYRLRGITKRT
ncbi:hypothetical protein ACFLR5_01525, partial [Elusimicrobiota bacterium]